MRSFFFASAAIALSFAVTLSPAKAAFVLEIQSGAQDLKSTDANAATEGFTVTSDTIVFSGTVNGQTVDTEVALRNPAIGSPTDQALALTHLNVSSPASGSGGTVVITASGTDYAVPAAYAGKSAPFIAAPSVTLGAGTSASYVDSYDPTNALNGMPAATSLTGSFSNNGTNPPASLSDSRNQSMVVTVTNPFSETIQATLTTTGPNQSVQFQDRQDVLTPEPGMLAILASGLPLLGLCKLRRRRQAKVA